MIDINDLNKDNCFVCEKKLNIKAGKDMDKFVYVHFTDQSSVNNNRSTYLYFCPECWRNTAGDEFCLEGFEK